MDSSDSCIEFLKGLHKGFIGLYDTRFYEISPR